jgi:U3 small nucleolar RNA-associated protein 14
MPPRVARSSIQSGGASGKGQAKSRNPKKAQKRALDAFSIAQYENPDDGKVRKNRLGEFDPAFKRKRARDDDEEDEEDEDEDEGPKRRKRKSGDESFDEGSDSDGNTWQMGHVDNDDSDESIDSDEAFGESDEERFEGFTFRGSSKNHKGKAKKSKREQDMEDEDGDIDLEEGDSADGEEEEDDDLGEDAIDLATALDQYEEDEAEERREKKKKKQASAFGDSDEEPSEGEDVGEDGASDLSSDEEDDEEDRQAQLQNLISSLASREDDKPKGRRVDVHESAAPDEFGVSRKVDLLSFKPKVADAEKKKALKLLQDDKSSKRNDIARKLDAPLPKRQQDKLDRAAANAKANETLERWTDTIKRNRRAEHLMFPLQNASGGEPMGEKTLLPTTTAAPTNDLESTIQSILQQSGLSNGKEDEEKIQKWEELQTNKLPVEEVLKRRAELRMQRELLFREEVRAKRIKKIKSKAYRRVHRREREKLLEKEREQLKADGVDLSEEEREYNDRRRAEERMGAKHRESKWAKGIKATGRANWDQDALDGVTEMARRNEELRRRVEGKTIRDDDDEGSDVPSEEESDDDDEQSDNDALQQSLGKLKQNPFSTKGSKLGQMAFMQKSEAAKRAQNDEAVEQLRRELAGEDSDNAEIDENATKAGRRKYGPNANVAAPAIQINRNEFEEHDGSDDENGANPAAEGEEPAADGPAVRAPGQKKNGMNGLSNGARKDRKAAQPLVENGSGESNPFLVKAKKEKKVTKEPELFPVTGVADPITKEKAIVQPKSTPKPKSQKKSKQDAQPQETKIDDFLKQRVSTADDDGWATVLGGQDDDDDQDEQDIEDEGIDLDVVMHNQSLTAKAFAGDDVEADFAAEKKATIADEEATEEVSFLPGWGSWTGDGMSKAEKKRNLGAKTVIKKPGIDADRRKDKKMDKVIINERRVKPNVKYMASQLPFPFENREQYERSLRVPKGKEWVTKKTHQDVTKPRVIVKQGVIAPLRKPLA